MARYLVTGGAGFIGGALVAALARAGERPRVLDDLSTGSIAALSRLVRAGDLDFVRGDVADPSVVARAMTNVEVVFHLAAVASVPASFADPLATERVNERGTLNVLEAARTAGVRRVIVASSAAVYGDVPGPHREDRVPRPLSPYAASKLAAEHHAAVYAVAHGLETMSLRYFNVFGPGQRPDGAYAAAIPRFLSAALRGAPIRVDGDGRQTRDFCFVDDVVRANLAAANAAGRLAGEAVNVAGGRPASVREVIGAIEDVAGRPLAIAHGPARRGDVRASSADLARARERLGFTPRTRWEDGLAPTLAWLRELAALEPYGAGVRA